MFPNARAVGLLSDHSGASLGRSNIERFGPHVRVLLAVETTLFRQTILRCPSFEER